MKSIRSKVTRVLPFATRFNVCDNSGAKEARLFTVYGIKTTRRRNPSARVGDLVMCNVTKGKPEMKGTVVLGVVVRQKKEYKRPNGESIKFEDNSIVVTKDNKGNPKGTVFKGPIAKEAAERWPPVAKLARIVV
ncbi:uL14 family ribosomal protein [Candidatus Woesearchaeota archaeon]|nr:uL14 family ribosomal protein [Candidatus Woesearchaeota archaeon]